MTTDLEELDNAQPDESAVIRDLRKQAEQAKTEKERADKAERELVLHKADLGNLTDKQMKALTAAHEGDWDAEALKVTATELGFVKEQESEPEPRVPQQELDAMARVHEASNGEPPARTDLDTALEAAKDDPEQIKALLANNGLLVED